MKNRIKMIRKELGLTQKEFAEAIDVSQNFIAQIEIGTKSPSDRTIRDMCNVFNLNESWLLSGEGEPYRSLSRNQRIAEFMNRVMDQEDDVFKKRFIAALSQLPDEGWLMLEELIKTTLNPED